MILIIRCFIISLLLQVHWSVVTHANITQNDATENDATENVQSGKPNTSEYYFDFSKNVIDDILNKKFVLSQNSTIDSVIQNQSSLEKIKHVISRLYEDANKPKEIIKTNAEQSNVNTQVAQQAYVSKEIITLQSIIYNNTKDWTIWVNGHKYLYKDRDKVILDGHYGIVRVTKHFITFVALKPSATLLTFAEDVSDSKHKERLQIVDDSYLSFTLFVGEALNMTSGEIKEK